MIPNTTNRNSRLGENADITMVIVYAIVPHMTTVRQVNLLLSILHTGPVVIIESNAITESENDQENITVCMLFQEYMSPVVALIVKCDYKT